MNFIWKKIYETGITEIDEQHKYFVELINRLYSEITKENNHKGIDEIIEDLKQYANYHFDSEEKQFKKFKYPSEEIDLHIKAHDKFYNRIDSFYENKTISKGIVGYRIAEFLRKWLIDHILVSDMRFANYVKENYLSNYYM